MEKVTKQTASVSEAFDAIQNKLARYFGISPKEANKEQMYKATVLAIRDILANKNKMFNAKVKETGSKRIYYMCMEFLIGRSLKMNLKNLGIEDEYKSALKEMGFSLDEIYDLEPDAALGNGGLGRLAACFMDSLATLDYPARGFSILYEYGLFKQKIADGEQLEMPDVWLPRGESWLVPRQDRACTVRFGGKVSEKWEDGHCRIIHEGYDEVEAVPYDMMISGADSESIALLRLWKAQDVQKFNMELFSKGQYVKAMEDDTLAQTISKVLYPNDNHQEGKLLRLSQQYFLVSASLQYIVADHLFYNKTLSNLPEKAAIHINDTHPALVIPELMRILLDIYNYTWEDAWDIVVRTVSYTNHTILPEALEKWNEELFRFKLPRIYMIIREINERFCAKAWEKFPGNWDKVGKMSVINHSQIHMANLSVIGSHSINGVSRLHSDILTETVFKDYYDMYPERFTNVTNGVAHRKWLCYSNPELAKLLDECIGTGYRKDASQLQNFEKFADDDGVVARLKEIKHQNKVNFSNYAKKAYGISLDPDSIFDVQVKRLHEYKRQLMNALKIINIYLALKENPDLEMTPMTFIFGAKAAPGYYIAKDIIRLICFIASDIEKNVKMKSKIRVLFAENYNVTLAENLIPAADISEQISLAGKEASGTSNMKFMMNGALTLGTLDGANVEMSEALGRENIYIFGHTAEEVKELWQRGYASSYYYNRNEKLKRVIDYLQIGFDGRSFSEIANYLLFSYGIADPYMCLADFDPYVDTFETMIDFYNKNNKEWNRKSLINIARSGIFAADRSITEYAERIWGLKRLI
ncbi:MAG: glycogen/starch/alpha-glucan phosphorylase [Clostridia bacterium]|nr:glycogen/starch/alpha-glucan phosphorylase [Clostridia bacterium]